MKKKEETFFQLISQKPWEASQAKLDNKHDGKTLKLSREKIGVRTIMVVSTVIFSFFVYYFKGLVIFNFSLHNFKEKGRQFTE